MSYVNHRAIELNEEELIEKYKALQKPRKKKSYFNHNFSSSEQDEDDESLVGLASILGNDTMIPNGKKEFNGFLISN